jgi:DNA-binding GntR family transcriptional regulator
MEAEIIPALATAWAPLPAKRRPPRISTYCHARHSVGHSMLKVAVVSRRTTISGSDGMSMSETLPDITGARGGTVDRLVESLRAGILSGRYMPGQRLIEAELTRDFNVSRGPLREAFRRLSAEKLLQIVPNRGALVRQLSYREIVEIFQIRGAIEPLSARLAAQAIGQEDSRRRFEAAIGEIWDDAPRRDPGYHQENQRFHLAIFAVCGNDQLADFSRQLQLPLVLLQLSGAKTPGMFQDSVLEHREIATAILQGDERAAEAAMHRHLERACHIIETMPESIFRAPPDRRAEKGRPHSSLSGQT